MADCGVASRRACEELILEGRVQVDNKVVRILGTKINPMTEEFPAGDPVPEADRERFEAVRAELGPRLDGLAVN